MKIDFLKININKQVPNKIKVISKENSFIDTKKRKL